MKQLLVDCISFEYVKDNLFEATNNDPSRRLVVKGILQRSGVKNQNGRVYTKNVLVREAGKYSENFIKERRALGELDHPECHRVDAQALTNNGWKYIKDVSIGEHVATLNTEKNSIEYQPVERVIIQPYNGKMISIKGKNIDVLVTPNHKFIVTDRNGKFLETTAVDILKMSKLTNNPHLSIPIVVDVWEGTNYTGFELEGVSRESISDNQSENFILKQTSPLMLDPESWFSFLGFYLAEGHCTNRKTSDGYGVFITQNRGEIADEFRKILKTMTPELMWNEWDKGDNAITFNTSDARLWTYLSKLGDKYTKFIPNEIINASPNLLQKLYDWFLNGDGSIVGEHDRTSVFSVSKNLIDDFYEVVLKLGMTGVIKEQISDNDYMFAGRLIEIKNKVPLYRLWIKSSKAIHLDFRFIKIEEVDYNDNVYCLTLKNGNFYCQDHNKPFWSGNSSVVNLQNVSHNVLEVHWEGDDLIGSIEVLPTPNGNILKELFRANIRLGISSRGMGTVQKDMRENADIVQDDFELIAFDFVSNPSTRGAFMFPNGNINEGLVKNPVTNQWEKAESIIRDILTEIGK